jgi:hypothetical protein
MSANRRFLSVGIAIGMVLPFERCRYQLLGDVGEQ